MTDVPALADSEEELAEQERLLLGLTEQLATKETEFATTGTEFARFRVHYLRRFGPLYAEIDRLEAEIARRVAVLEDTPATRAHAAETLARAEASQAPDPNTHDAAANAIAEDLDWTGPTSDLRALYRKAAKRVHPDLAADNEDRVRRTRLMALLNAAYRMDDADAIKRILDGEAARPEFIPGDDTASRLARATRRIAQIHARIAELARLSEALSDDPLFELFLQVREAWHAGQDPLLDDETVLRVQLSSAQAQLAALTAADTARAEAGDG